jgi:cytochrome c oxidase assembly protein subunit 15
MSADGRHDSPQASCPPHRRALHFLALCAAVFTFPLLFVGGSVTTYRVGLAVPDWPTTFGINMFLYDFWNAPFGVRVEHTHRLYGAAVGLATVILAGCLLAFDSRRWMKVLGALALSAVIVQGILGGARVTQLSTFLAAVHAATAQAFFALMVGLCVLTGPGLQSRGVLAPDPDHLRHRALVLFLLSACQIMLGSWLRHYAAPAALWLHIACGVTVWGLALVLLGKVRRQHPARGALSPAAWALVLLTNLSVLLGIASVVYLLPFDGTPRPVSFYQAVARTSHQTLGALVLAASLVLCLRAYGHRRRSRETSEPCGQPAALNCEVAT